MYRCIHCNRIHNTPIIPNGVAFCSWRCFYRGDDKALMAHHERVKGMENNRVILSTMKG